MPVIWLDRLPLPNLQAYSTFSIILLSCSIYYAIQSTWYNILVVADNESSNFGKLSINNIEYFSVVFRYMLKEPLCLWSLVFGELRVSEQQHIKDKFWNFVFYKFILIFGVVTVQDLHEVILWCSWFSVLGFLHLLSQLCKDRFEYLALSPTTSKQTHIRLLSLLLCILFSTNGLLFISLLVGLRVEMSMFYLTAPEYGLHLYELKQQGIWEMHASISHVTEFIIELMALTADFLHHAHMLLHSNIVLSGANLVIFFELRMLWQDIQQQIRRNRNYWHVLRHLEASYPMATKEELSTLQEPCAICWEHLEVARRLPCLHYFHSSCLRSWLEQDTSCPTCRRPLDKLVNKQSSDQTVSSQRTGHIAPPYNRSRFISWLPSFSVEVQHTHTQLFPPGNWHTSQLEIQARHLQEIFPNVHLSSILQDLNHTHSVEMTIDNILEGHLEPSPPMFQDSEELSSSLASTKSEVAEYTVLHSSQPLHFSTPSPPTATTFSKNSKERERMLHYRRKELLQRARHKYLQNHIDAKSDNKNVIF